jgi:hypothetical protein
MGIPKPTSSMWGVLTSIENLVHAITRLDVINVLRPFMAFAISFNHAHAHEMCAFQLEGLQCVVD